MIETNPSYYVTRDNLQKKNEQWLQRINDFNQHKMELNPSKAALMVIDMQNFFLILPLLHLPVVD
jgi:isochorismate hydrolase